MKTVGSLVQWNCCTVSLDNSMCNYIQFKSSSVWRPSAGENAEQEYNSPIDKFAVKVIKNSETVGLLPQEFSQVQYLGISCMWRKDMGQSDWPQAACGGMEIPCLL